MAFNLWKGSKLNNEEKSSSLNWMFHWSLPGCKPRVAQQKILNRIIWAIENGYKNIILEAGTGIGTRIHSFSL